MMMGVLVDRLEKTTESATLSHAFMLLDHRMSLLVTASFFLLLFARERKKRKEKREREKKKSFTQSLLPEEAEFFADWLVRVYMVPEGMIGRKQRTDAYRKEKYT